VPYPNRPEFTGKTSRWDEATDGRFVRSRPRRL
jgi:hypothetical protein